MKKLIPYMLLLALLLAACGGQATEASPAEAAEPTAASDPAEASTPTPEPTPEPLVFPDGSCHDREETALDLRWLTHAGAAETAELLRQMPKLQTVELGADNALSEVEGEAAQPETPERLEWADIRALQEAAPQAEFSYRFRFCGKDFTLQDEVMDLNHRAMDDEGAAVRELLPCMTHCVYLDMDSCGVSNQAMAAIRDENPGVEVVWRVWFGDWNCCSVRTDTERIMASKEEFHLEKGDTEALRYCTKVKYLDLGHMRYLTDWSFLGYMPELEVAVISLGDWKDLSGLSNCPHLEYLEMSSRSHCDEPLDLGFLANLKELKHLNITRLYQVTGYEALEELPQLERLWIGYYTHIPEEEILRLREKLPDTEINTTVEAGIDGSWRYENGANVPRYELLRQQFDYAHYDKVCSLYWNDPLYYPHD